MCIKYWKAIILFACIILLHVDCKAANNGSNYEKKIYEKISDNIYYKVFNDAALYIFKENNIDYNYIVIKEFFPVVKNFQLLVNKHDLEKIINEIFSDKTIKELKESYEQKGIKFSDQDDFKKQWAKKIKNKKEQFYYRTSLNFILNDKILWMKYKWMIEPDSYLDENKIFVIRFNVIVNTDLDNSKWYGFRFIKEGKQYKLKEVDQGDNTIRPFYN
jgi:hypothetical protein